MDTGFEELLIIGELTEETVGKAIATMRLAINEGKREISLIISSPGGNTNSALALYEALQQFGEVVDISITAMAEVSSSAILVFLGADRRTATPNTSFGWHEIIGSYDGNYSTSEIMREAKKQNILQEKVICIISERLPVLSEESIRELMRNEKVMDVVDAKEIGLLATSWE